MFSSPLAEELGSTRGQRMDVDFCIKDDRESFFLNVKAFDGRNNKQCLWLLKNL